MTPSARRLPLRFDPARLQADLARVPQADWQGHFNRPIYQGDWSVVPLRATPGSPIPIFSIPGEQDQEDTALLQACDYFQQVLAAFRCPLLSVRLLRLGPGAAIREHSDPDLSLAHKEVRIHVVAATNPGVECRIGGTPYHWAAGECWYADFTQPHAFANRGDTERVHLVLDCTLNDWLRQLIEGWDAARVVAGTNNAVFEVLREAVHADPELQAHLSILSDRQAFVAAVRQLAQGLGFTLDDEAVLHALRAGHLV